ncbi:MAG: hypothetical protein KA180_15350 [Gemmatimonadales bacterium]|nr:hypothetical protein [Gemmatimonadales bacterium]MBP9198825.1 hypothetical protein [Gemmatimonadales bacterium]
MARRGLGLDWFDLLLHAGVTFALCVVAGSVATEQPEALIGTVVAASLVALGLRRKRALQQAPGETTGEVQAERIFALEDRVAELEATQGRTLELEERLDFAERLLSQQREPARLPGERPAP